MNVQEFKYAINTVGYMKFENVIDQKMLEEMRSGVDLMLSQEESLGRNHFYLAHNHLPFLKFLEENPLQAFVDSQLGDTCIIHSYNGITLMPNIQNPIQNAIHRDSPRFCRPYLLSMQILLMLDDFNKENGATYVLPGSQHVEEKPSEGYFYENAVQLEGSSGDGVVFDSMLWHAGGLNRTFMQRRGLTIVYTRPFMKQQIDLTKATDPEILSIASSNLHRLLGFNVRVPTNLNEFNLPKEERLYKANQG